MKFLLGFRGRRPDQRKRGIRELLPYRKIVRCECEPPELEHVSTWFGHASDLLPADFIDDQSFLLRESATAVTRRDRDFRLYSDPERSSTHAHFENVELQGERR
jgi:hypothetical protein